MSVHRVMGIETEYGISSPQHPHADPVSLSTQVVNAYALKTMGPRKAFSAWSYDDESPLRDARGYDMSRSDADPSQLTDADFAIANVVLTNGARLYVDHAHPEYSSPEVTNPMDAVLWDVAGERVMAAAAIAAEEAYGEPIRLYKNNADNKGASYGCHENYLVQREVPFASLVTHLTPFFVTRQVFAGCGRVGIGQSGSVDGFQISSRADYFETEVGLETTLKRPIINTRDEPHADPALWRRLHVIVGDANLSQTATLIKVGATALILSMIEDGYPLPEHDLVNPVLDMHQVSHDWTGHRLVQRNRRSMSALDIQFSLLESAEKYMQGKPFDGATDRVLTEWRRVLEDLASDPSQAADRVDWVAKKQLLDGYRLRDHLTWTDARLHLVDLQYSDVRLDKGLALRLMERGRLTTLFSADHILEATDVPPTDTRAYFRGEAVRRYPQEVVAASWESVIFDIDGEESLQRVPLIDPHRGTKEHVGALFERCDSAASLLAALSKN